MDRRTFIFSSALSSIGLSALGATKINDSHADKACVFVYLHGGISHIDFTHPGVNVPNEYRSVLGTVDTNGGYYLAGGFNSLAKLGNKLTVVKSFTHRDGNHSTAAGWVNTGHPMLGAAETAEQKEPSYGSIVSKVNGEMTQVGIPSYIKTSKIDFGARRDGAAWLGSKYVGFDVDDEGIRNLSLGVDKKRGDDRMRLVESIDRGDQQLFKEWTGLRRTAYNIAMGPAGQVFNLKLESPEVLQKFKVDSNSFGKNILTAVRSVQQGSRFVTIVNGGWDMHNDIQTGMSTKVPELDWGLSLLITELEARGLLDKTLVVVTTEFGRTPKININNGRDHWNNVIPLIFAGGGYNHGKTIGTTDKNNDVVSSKKFEPKDLCNTILSHFDIKKGDKVIDSLNRPRYLIEDTSSNILEG